VGAVDPRLLRRARPKRQAKTFVGALMLVHRSDDLFVSDIGRGHLDPSVVAQRRIDRQAPRCGLDREPLKPFVRDEIEQRRSRDQIDRTV